MVMGKKPKFILLTNKRADKNNPAGILKEKSPWEDQV